MLATKSIRFLGWLMASLLVAASALAQPVQVQGAWARATVPGQASGGAFMILMAPAGARLEGVSTPAAGAAEIHEMVLQDNIMRMRPLAAGIDLPPGRPVELKPGGLHLMLLELKAPLVAGSVLPLVLHLRDRQGVTSRLELQVPVRALGAAPASSIPHGRGH